MMKHKSANSFGYSHVSSKQHDFQTATPRLGSHTIGPYSTRSTVCCQADEISAHGYESNAIVRGGIGKWAAGAEQSESWKARQLWACLARPLGTLFQKGQASVHRVVAF